MEIQWVVGAAILVAGLIGGWLLRQWALNGKKESIIKILDKADLFFGHDESKLAQYVVNARKHADAIEKHAAAMVSSAELANEQMHMFFQEFRDIYGDDAVPTLIREAKDGLKKLEPEKSE